MFTWWWWGVKDEEGMGSGGVTEVQRRGCEGDGNIKIRRRMKAHRRQRHRATCWFAEFGAPRRAPARQLVLPVNGAPPNGHGRQSPPPIEQGAEIPVRFFPCRRRHRHRSRYRSRARVAHNTISNRGCNRWVQQVPHRRGGRRAWSNTSNIL